MAVGGEWTMLAALNVSDRSLHGRKTFRGVRHLVCATDLCHFPWAVPHRVRLQSSGANSVHLTLLRQNSNAGVDFKPVPPWPTCQDESLVWHRSIDACAIFFVTVRGEPRRPLG